MSNTKILTLSLNKKRFDLIKRGLNLCPIIHEHNYVCIKELPMFPIIDGWQTFKVITKCKICKRTIETYVKKISNIGK